MAFERGEKKFLNAKTSPLSSLLYFGAGVARPSGLTWLFFFLRGTLTMSPPSSWISVLPNLILLKLELGVDYLFLKQTNSKRKLRIQRIRGCLAVTFSTCLARGRGDDQSVVTPSPLASVPVYLQVRNNLVWPILTASLSYLDWFLLLMFCLYPRR